MIMYRVNYQFDKHNVSILMLCVKDGDSWKQLSDPSLEHRINDKLKNISETYDTDKGGFGEVHLTENLNFITGSVDLNK